VEVRGVKLWILITYDVNTETAEGRKRLRKVAKACEDYGLRVQNSVFECEMDSGQWLKVKHRLVNLIDTKTDSLRFYSLGNDRQKKVEHIGAKPTLDVTEPLII
jgi:CRISPR-associated protein Cas2